MILTAEEYVVSVLTPLGYPCTIGKGSVLSSIPYISVWHVQDIILNSTATGLPLFQSTLLRVEYESNTGSNGITVGNAIRALLTPPVLILQEGQSITNPTAGTTNPPAGGDLRFFLVCVNLAKIQP